MLSGYTGDFLKKIQAALLKKKTTMCKKKILGGINGSLGIAVERVMNLTMQQ